MLNVNVQTVALVAQQSALAHLCIVYQKAAFSATQWAKAAGYPLGAGALIPPLKRAGFRA